jgi:hypothetical protein
MQKILRFTLAVAAAIACVLIAGVLVAAPENARGALDLTTLLPAFALGQKLQMPTAISSFSFEGLRARAKPGAGGGAEANIDVLFDTQTYVAAGQAQLNFFNAPSADETLTNMDPGGTLSDSVYFDVWRIFVDANRVPTATSIAGVGAGPVPTAAGVYNDIATILHAARATLTFRMFDKPIGPIPLTFFGHSGTVEGIINHALAGAYTAATSQFTNIQAGRMPDNGGWPVNGTIKIPASTKFKVELKFVAGVAIAVDTPLRVSLLGVKYRTPA